LQGRLPWNPRRRGKEKSLAPNLAINPSLLLDVHTSALIMEAAYSSETSIIFYKTTPYHNPVKTIVLIYTYCLFTPLSLIINVTESKRILNNQFFILHKTV
jgi:hypothetical protein